MWELRLRNGVTARYVPVDDSSNWGVWSAQGKLRLIMDGDPTPQKIRGALDALRDLNIETRLATREDMEYLYLIKVTNAAGGLNQLTIDLNLPVAQRTRILLDWWTARLGKDPRTLPTYDPLPRFPPIAPILQKSGVKTGTFGRPRWQRFDITEAELEAELGDVWLAHGVNNLYGGGPSYDKLKLFLEANGDLISTEEKFRLGIPLSNTSPFSILASDRWVEAPQSDDRG